MNWKGFGKKFWLNLIYCPGTFLGGTEENHEIIIRIDGAP
jgi:hypothetical protein